MQIATANLPSLLIEMLLGTTFTMRLVEPMKSGFQTIAPRGGNKPASKKGYGTGKETLRFKANGNATIEDEVR
jgi:PDZ domain-containing protein GIPC